MTDDEIRELLLDLPLVDGPGRPQGMLAMRRSDVPEDVRDETDAWVQAHGGQIGEVPLIEVIGGRSPKSGPPGEMYYALAPAAFVTDE
jgi:hypothetical protein